MKLPIDHLEKKIGYSFKNTDLIEAALTHSSAGHKVNYQRLEFLGDRVLGLVIAQLLFHKFPQEQEGDMAKRLSALVQGSLLAEIALEIDLGSYINFSNAEREAGGKNNENILADVFESVIGALYLDSGFEKCQVLIEKLWESRLHEMKTPPQHPKTSLQEWAQGKGLPLPEYEITGQHGPDHSPIFDIRLCVKGYPSLTVQGRSRQDAEKTAAAEFMDVINEA